MHYINTKNTIKKYSIKTTNWNKDKDSLSKIRKCVFIKEQNVPEELEWDEFDEQCIHVLVTDNNSNSIACGRINSDGQIGRMAVLKEHRNTDIGTAILQLLLNAAKDSQQSNVFLHAQITAIPFYEKQGFEVCSDKFMDAGIPHKTMKKTIS